MVDKVKIEPKIITIHEGRPSFLKVERAYYRTNRQGQEIKTRPDGTPVKPRYSWTWLLDPSNKQAAETIAEIKAEAMRQLDLFWNGRENWPKDNAVTGTKGVLLCFGRGNDLPKVYDGYKDMWYIKVSDTTAPIIGDRRGRAVQFVGNAWHYVDPKTGATTEEVANPSEIPYGGCYARGRISLYPYNNESAGINANARSCQFLRPGPAFGGQVQRSAADELEQMAGDAELVSQGTAQADPWG
jgi:hypothetical protein